MRSCGRVCVDDWHGPVRSTPAVLWRAACPGASRFLVDEEALAVVDDGVANQHGHKGRVLLSIAFLGLLHQRRAGRGRSAARDCARRFFYVGGKSVTLNGRPYMSGQMYVEFRIPAKQTHPFPIVMVHGGTMSGTNFTGTPDGREAGRSSSFGAVPV